MAKRNWRKIIAKTLKLIRNRIPLINGNSEKTSQDVVAEEMGTTRQALSAMERGKTSPNIEKLEEFLLPFGLCLHIMILRDGDIVMSDYQCALRDAVCEMVNQRLLGLDEKGSQQLAEIMKKANKNCENGK